MWLDQQIKEKELMKNLENKEQRYLFILTISLYDTQRIQMGNMLESLDREHHQKRRDMAIAARETHKVQVWGICKSVAKREDGEGCARSIL